jgi:hypothetical protein
MIVRSWPLAAVTLDRLGTTAIEGTADQSRVSRWLIAAPKPRPSTRWRGGSQPSIFQRAAAGRSDPDAAGGNRLALRVHARALYCCKPGAHEAGQRPACEALSKHVCSATPNGMLASS